MSLSWMKSDQMSSAAQLYLLSKLDATEKCPRTIWIFTCNSVDRLEERFVSRCIKLDFASYGSSTDVTALLEHIWAEKAPADAPKPNFKKLASGNIRESLMKLETELLLA